MHRERFSLRDGTIIWAAWSTNAILVFRQQEGGTVQQVSLPRKMKADLRYFLKFYNLNDGSLLLRSGNGFGTCLDLARDSERFQPIEGWPESLSTYPPYQIIPLKNGTIAGVRSNVSQLILWQPEAPFHISKLPEGFIIRDVDRDDQNRLWICGALPTRKLRSLKYRRALASSDDEGMSWNIHEVLHGGIKVAWQSLLSGAETTYRTVKIVNNVVALSAETDNYDETSTVIFVRDRNGRWRSDILKDDILRAFLPVQRGGLEIISHYGQAVSITSHNKWQYQSLLPRLHTLMQGMDEIPPEGARYEILDAQAAPRGSRILVISVRVPEENRLVRFGEAVATLTERRDHLITFNNKDEAEIITATHCDRSE